MRTIPLHSIPPSETSPSAAAPAVSALCLGTMYFGTKVDEATSFALMDMYVEAGGGFLDTANKYASWLPGFSGGESEALIGRWMRARGNRGSLFLSTKVGLPMPGVEKGLRARQIEEECEKSLQRLGTDAIDLYYAHADDRETPLEESLEAFERLVRAGKVRFLGASNMLAWRLHESRLLSARDGRAGYVCVQARYSYLQPNPWMPQEFAAQIPASPELLDYSAATGVRILAYSPLLGGAYARSDRPLHASYAGRDNEERLTKLRAAVRETGASANQLVLSWLLWREPAIIPVIAASTPDQLQENLAACGLPAEATAAM
jgi:aryl-alcohol dehydrogenase-like predicted oxidoreductase